MRPDQASFLLSFLLPQLKSEQAITAKLLRSIPPDRADYRPHPKSMSALRLARHIATTEVWFLDAVIHRRFADDETLPAGMEHVAGIANWYDENFQSRMPVLESLSGEHLAEPVDYLGLRNDPAVAYLNIAIRHAVHHRGQLSAYLRPMDAKVPAIYVESGDEPYPPADPSAAAGELPKPPAF